MAALDAAGYPPAIAELLRALPLAPLGPGRPPQGMRSKLEEVEAAFPTGANRDMVAACRAGLWLAFDFLDEAHAISQDLHTAEGSYWHALMHRREPDFSNSKYWFRQVGEHPVFAELAKAAVELGYPVGETWAPSAFVDACARAIDKGGAEEELCRRVQRAEWELLFAFCYERAMR